MNLLKQVSIIEDVEKNSEGLDKKVLIEALSVTEFSAPVNAYKLLQQLAEAKYQVKVGQDFDIKSANVVQFRRCKLFDETLASHENVTAKLQEFISFKTNDPMGRFGKKDQHFTSGGILVQTGLIHAHLTGDISILYKRSGRNPTIIDLVAILSHDELGTGQPPNIKVQKAMVKTLNAQTFESTKPKVVGFMRLNEEYVPPDIEGQKITAYHGGNTFDSHFDLKFSGSGEGYRILGPGAYFITSKNLAKSYTKYASTETASVYTVEIDVDNFYNFMLRPTPRMKETMEKIAEYLGFTYDTMPRNYDSLKNGRGFIGEVVKHVGHKKAQEIFKKFGLNGALESIDYGNGKISWEIAVFDLSKVKIVDREEFKPEE